MTELPALGELAARLAEPDGAPREPEEGGLRMAAVMVPLLETGDGTSLLLTRRSAELPHHSGQVAFPGGMREPADGSLWDTALRESEEEVGARPDGVRYLASLEPTDTLKRFRIQPYLCRLENGDYAAGDPREVARVFTLPLKRLLEPGARRQAVVEHAGRRHSVPAYPWDGEIVWGATYRIIQDFLLRLKTVL